MSNHDREDLRPSNRDEELARAWREVSDEQPPSHLDTAIIAAARKAVPDRAEQPKAAPVRVQPRNWLLQWQPLAVAATVAGLAFVLVQMLPREQDFAPSLQQKGSAPIPAPLESPPRSTSVPAAVDNSPLANTDKAVARPEPVIVPDRTPTQDAVSELSVAPASTEAAAGAMASEVAGRNATAAVAPPSASAREKSLSDAASVDAAAWSAKVVALHASGDVTAAAAALREFRAAYPGADAYLPDSLRSWARTVE
ncbi:MAG: hypothetical protein RL261_1614 [Pseudomonadota bacterium]|jgi:hypothetical protein